MKGMGRFLATCALAASGLGCAPAGGGAVVEQLVAGDTFGLPRSGLPPIFTGCGSVAPDFDLETYDPFADGFCTVSYTRRYSREGADVFLDEDRWVEEMGEPDPAAELPPHLLDIREQLAADGLAHYCHFRWRVEAAPVGTYPEEDVQELTHTLVDVSEYCTRPYVPDVVYVPGYTFRTTAIRSTRDDTFLFWSENLTDMGLGHDGSIRFCGYAGHADTTNPRGWMTYYQRCESDDAGLGSCATECRLFSPSDSGIRQCTWDDVEALPANPGLIEPSWIDEHRARYESIFGGDS